MKRIGAVLILIVQVTVLPAQKDFSFVYLPDLHLQPDSAVIANFEKVVRKINKLHPDFILTGGDMIYTAKNVDDNRAEVLFNLMDRNLGMFRMPVHLTMGNHETVGITVESGIDKTNPMWGKQMYEKRYGNRFYSFSSGEWKFFVLDGIRILEKEKNYTHGVDSAQIDWLKKELEVTGTDVPVVISIHTPIINPHAMVDPKSQALSENSQAVMNLFKDHNLKMILQGHNHIYMNLFINEKYCISGGSTSYGTEPKDFGFLLVDVRKKEEDFQFIRTDNLK